MAADWGREMAYLQGSIMQSVSRQTDLMAKIVELLEEMNRKLDALEAAFSVPPAIDDDCIGGGPISENREWW